MCPAGTCVLTQLVVWCICSSHGKTCPQISAQTRLHSVQALVLFPTGHYVVMGQCKSLVNYVTPVHTAAGGTGSVSAAESAKLSSTIYMGLLSVSLSSKKILRYKTGCVEASQFCCFSNSTEEPLLLFHWSVWQQTKIKMNQHRWYGSGDKREHFCSMWLLSRL